jgi:hypothetical protein
MQPVNPTRNLVERHTQLLGKIFLLCLGMWQELVKRRHQPINLDDLSRLTHMSKRSKNDCRTQARFGSGRSRPWSSCAIDKLKAHGVSVDDKYLPKYAQRTGRTQSTLASV